MGRKVTARNNYVKPVLIGGVTAFLGSVILIFVVSIMIFFGWMEYDQVRRLAVASCAVSGFLCSFFSVRRMGGYYSIPIAVLVVCIEFLFLLIMGIILFSGNISFSVLLPLLISCLCSGALAGFAGKKRNKRRRT